MILGALPIGVDGAGFVRERCRYHECVKSILRVAAPTLVTCAGLGLAGMGVASLAAAQPAPLQGCHWCPGQLWDPACGANRDQTRCHDEHLNDGEPQDAAHWHGAGHG